MSHLHCSQPSRDTCLSASAAAPRLATRAPRPTSHDRRALTPPPCTQLRAVNPLLDLSKSPDGWQPPYTCGYPTGAWLSTGLWAPAGAKVTIRLLPTSDNLALAKSKLYVQIGSHIPDLFLCRNYYCRAPAGTYVKKTFADDAAAPAGDTIEMASVWGGLIYIGLHRVSGPAHTRAGGRGACPCWPHACACAPASTNDRSQRQAAEGGPTACVPLVWAASF